eukprot:5274536-Amphidinium_carterae.1
MHAACSNLVNYCLATWKHPSGHLQQIDFLCACSASVALVKELHLEPWGFLDLQTTSDHRMVSMELECGVGVKPKSCSKPCRFVSDEHYDLFAQALSTSPPMPWDGSTPAVDYVNHLMVDMQTKIKETLPKRSPRKAWISPRTWSFMELLNKYRKLLSGLQRGDTTALPQLARAIIQHDGEKFFPAGDVDATAGCISAIRTLSAVKKRLIRADRKSWLQSLCDRVQGRADAHDLHNFHKTIRQICRSDKGRKGLRLMDNDGVLIDDRDKVNSMWHSFWRQHFSATDVTPASFSDRLTRVYDEPLGAEHGFAFSDETEDDDISELQVLQAIKRMESRRASPDPIPARAWKLFAPAIALPLARLFSDFKQTRSVPLSYSGSQVVGVFKKKGSPYVMKNFRPVSLMMVEAKLFSRLLLEMLQKRLRQHSAQLVRCSHGNSVPAIDHSSSSVCCTFTHLCSEAGLESVGYSRPQAEVIVEFLHAHPPILAECGVPTGILAVLRAWGSHTWISTQSGDPDEANSCRTLLGVKQGDCMAAQVFDIFYGHILSRLYQKLREEGLLMDLTLPVGRSLDHAARDGAIPQTIQLGPVRLPG